MGSPKKPKKQYKKPLVIWDSDLIEEQKILLKEYGLKNKKEIWRTEGFITKLRDQAKNLIAGKTEQSIIEKEQLIKKLVSLGLLKPASQVEDILSLDTKNVLERRLQTIIFKKNVSKSIKQARQFIVHGHIAVNNEKLTIPSFLVPINLESKLTFNPSSELSNDQHPERIKEKSAKQGKKSKEKLDETDIFAGDKKEEVVKKEVEEKVKPIQENPIKEVPKEPTQKIEEVIPEKKEEEISAGKK
jgi:small subunit ribosomal protein S4